jgi:hypothetical protein
MIEDGADDIITQADDPDIQRQALLWKANAIPMVHEALFHSDPLVAIVDTKAFVLQMIQYFESGPGKTAFGPWHVTALAVCREMNGILVEIGERLVGEKRNREFLEDLMVWVRKNPITSPTFYRPSLSAEMASIIGEKSVNAFKAMGSLAIGMDDIAARMNVYARHLPKQARWQAELLISDELPPESARIVLGELMVLTDAARRAADVVEAGPDVIAAEREIVLNRIEAERSHVLGALSAEHVLARTWLGGEREIVLAAVSEHVQQAERSLSEMIARERKAVLSEAEAIRERLIVDAVEHTEAMVNRLLIKVGLMGLAGMLCLFGMLWLLRRKV